MVRALRTARAHHVRPLTMWGERDGGQWTDEDILLSQALTEYEDSVCSCGCGGWEDECRDEELKDDDIWDARVGVHHRKAVLQQAEKDHAEQLKEPGTYVYLVDTRRTQQEE